MPSVPERMPAMHPPLCSVGRAIMIKGSMNSRITGLRVAGIVFGLMTLAQVMRLVIRPEIFVAGHAMPLWPSVLAVVILGGLSLWMWNLARPYGTPMRHPATYSPPCSVSRARRWPSNRHQYRHPAPRVCVSRRPRRDLNPCYRRERPVS